MRFLNIVFFFLICTYSFAQEWQSNYEKAVETASSLNHNIILVFSGSDWCAPCIKLDKNIWQSNEFKSYAKENWVLLRADFPRKKSNKLSEVQSAQNSFLAEKYNKNGHFPLVLVLGPTGKVLGETGFKNISPSEYVALLKNFKN